MGKVVEPIEIPFDVILTDEVIELNNKAHSNSYQFYCKICN